MKSQIPDTVASKVLTEILEETGKSAVASIAPLLNICRVFALVFTLFSLMWLLCIMLIGPIGGDKMAQVRLTVTFLGLSFAVLAISTFLFNLSRHD